ncbi:M15 family metallopeptidase [Pseudodesulfovibrio sp.]|uniref:M15 family metallopeptidase n=1 Tax=Pseudodesulfovibrio sp. TaxID=2035812 RepID=UPI00260AB3B8|nr:M15 family metallopeptidase [Pseudodesulfovibrio sp.]MDD3312210.1 M15 family metallopeptidase [Pseudodesulfovibrio sp.]
MRLPRLLPFLLALFCLAAPVRAAELPEGFVHVGDLVPGAVLDVRYCTAHNFVGAPVDGYLAPQVILSRPAAEALAGVQEDLKAFGLGLKIYDGYRPQRAVDHFVRWGRNLKDTKMKAEFYPDVDKKNLFRDGYIATRSGHTRGSTVDLTVIDLRTGLDLDMGGPFDFFGRLSWPGNLDLPPQARANRALLREAMARHGFKPLSEEWWHFTLIDEPFPDTYFDFPVE